MRRKRSPPTDKTPTPTQSSGGEQKEVCSLEAASSSACNGKGKDDEIRKKAYELYERKGCQAGHDWEDWLEAEKMLSSKSGASR